MHLQTHQIVITQPNTTVAPDRDNLNFVPSSGITEFILATAILIRSLAMLIQVLTPLLRKPKTKEDLQ